MASELFGPRVLLLGVFVGGFGLGRFFGVWGGLNV